MPSYTYYWEKEGNLYALRLSRLRLQRQRGFEPDDLVAYATDADQRAQVEARLAGKTEPYMEGGLAVVPAVKPGIRTKGARSKREEGFILLGEGERFDVPVAPHQVILAFETVRGAELLSDWLQRHGYELFQDYVAAAQKEDKS